MREIEEQIEKHRKFCQENRTVLLQKGIKGPWDDEPDLKCFEHAGVKCAILRHPLLLHLCGFDCAHFDDIVPIMPSTWDCIEGSGAYRDLDYVMKELQHLAEQLAEMKS